MNFNFLNKFFLNCTDFNYKLESNYANALNCLKESIIVTELANGSYIVDDIFERVFGHAAPTHGHHVLTFCRMHDGSYRFANYLNYWVKNNACYIGGAITDKNLMKNDISSELREKINLQGGLASISVMHAIERQFNNVSAFFIHTSVPRALEIIFKLGFKKTDEEFLYVKWTTNITKRRKRKLFAQAVKIGAF